MANFDHDKRYDELPEPIKGSYTPKEFAWLSDAEKASLVTNECLPDIEED